MDFHFHAANAVWTSAYDPVEARYIAAVKQDFAGRVDRVDFGQPAEAAARINQWVKRATAWRIDHLIDPDTLSPRTRMILTNGVYFRARWFIEEIFDKNSDQARTVPCGEVAVGSGADDAPDRHIADRPGQRRKNPAASTMMARHR